MQFKIDGNLPMTQSLHEARAEIERLVERFARNLDVYKRAEYKETQVRVEFIAPFFEALGWDVRNVRGYAEQYKDVVHEDAIKVGGATRAPDYCFRIGGARKFFWRPKRPRHQSKAINSRRATLSGCACGWSNAKYERAEHLGAAGSEQGANATLMGAITALSISWVGILSGARGHR
jgi:hypothetical protein